MTYLEAYLRAFPRWDEKRNGRPLGELSPWPGAIAWLIVFAVAALVSGLMGLWFGKPQPFWVGFVLNCVAWAMTFLVLVLLGGFRRYEETVAK